MCMHMYMCVSCAPPARRLGVGPPAHSYVHYSAFVPARDTNTICSSSPPPPRRYKPLRERRRRRRATRRWRAGALQQPSASDGQRLRGSYTARRTLTPSRRGCGSTLPMVRAWSSASSRAPTSRAAARCECGRRGLPASAAWTIPRAATMPAAWRCAGICARARACCSTSSRPRRASGSAATSRPPTTEACGGAG